MTIVITVIIAILTLCLIGGIYLISLIFKQEPESISGGYVTETSMFTVDDVLKNNIPIASISKLVLATIIKVYEERTGAELVNHIITPFEDRPDIQISVDDLLHMNSGIAFTIDASDKESVMKSIEILKNYRKIKYPTTYSNVGYMLLTYSLPEIIGTTYEKALTFVCDELGLTNTWSCKLWKPGSGDIVSTEEDMIKLGKYVQKNYEWFADDQSGQTYRGRGIDVISDKSTLIDNVVQGEFIIKDGGQDVPMTDNNEFEYNGAKSVFKGNNLRHACRLIIPHEGEVKFINSLDWILPFTNELTPDYHHEIPTFDPVEEICIDRFGNVIEIGNEVEVIKSPGYKIFKITEIKGEKFPEEIKEKSFDKVILKGRREIELDCATTIVNENLLECWFEMNWGSETKIFNAAFVIDNVNEEEKRIYLTCPFEDAERPYAYLDVESEKVVWFVQ